LKELKPSNYLCFQKKTSSDLSNTLKSFSYNIKLAYPVILGMLGHTLIGIVDNFMVGNWGLQLAAVSLGNSFIFIALSLDRVFYGNYTISC
jgi:MATE family multidrug resistance protein